MSVNIDKRIHHIRFFYRYQAIDDFSRTRPLKLRLKFLLQVTIGDRFSILIALVKVKASWYALITHKEERHRPGSRMGSDDCTNACDQDKSVEAWKLRFN